MTQSNLYDKILQASNYISNMSRKGASDYIITSHQFSKVISDIDKQNKRISKLKKIFKKYE
jgi:hypothetical protein